MVHSDGDRPVAIRKERIFILLGTWCDMNDLPYDGKLLVFPAFQVDCDHFGLIKSICGIELMSFSVRKDAGKIQSCWLFEYRTVRNEGHRFLHCLSLSSCKYFLYRERICFAQSNRSCRIKSLTLS